MHVRNCSYPLHRAAETRLRVHRQSGRYGTLHDRHRPAWYGGDPTRGRYGLQKVFVAIIFSLLENLLIPPASDDKERLQNEKTSYRMTSSPKAGGRHEKNLLSFIFERVTK